MQGSETTNPISHFCAERTIAVLGSLVSKAPISFDSAAGIVSVNTQARRLGCLTFLVCKVAGGRRVESLLLAPSREEIATLNENLRSNGHISGQLTKNASSIEHYLDAAIQLRLLTKQGAILALTNRGQFLTDIIRPNGVTPYPFAASANVFFFETILRADFFGIVAALRPLLGGPRSLSEVQEFYSQELLTVLARVGRSSVDSRLRRIAQDRIIAIRNWRKPESYAEHLVPAKLNWLLDLGIIEARSNQQYQINSRHHGSVTHATELVVPSEADLVGVVLNYGIALHVGDGAIDQNACALLNSAFAQIAQGKMLVKARCSEFVLFLLCFHANALQRQSTAKTPLFALPSIDCDDRTYRFTMASRSTQSFVICTQKGAP